MYQWGRNLSNRMNLPNITIDELPKYNYNERARDFQPRCHWGQMKLLMSEIQFLNHVTLDKDVNPKKTLVTYAGAAGGEHLEYLYTLYPDYDWLLIDPGSFSKAASHHPRRGAVKIRNEFFLEKAKINAMFTDAQLLLLLFLCSRKCLRHRLKPSHRVRNLRSPLHRKTFRCGGGVLCPHFNGLVGFTRH